MSRDPPAKKQKGRRTDAEIAELSPDEIMPPGDIHGPSGPRERLGRGAAPAPSAEAQVWRGIVVPQSGYLLPPPDLSAPPPPPPPPPQPEATPAPAPEHEHVHGPGCAHDHVPPAAPIVREGAKVGRNDPCPCGSGAKFKKCHGK